MRFADQVQREAWLRRVEDAAIAVHQAVDSRGLKIRLCGDPMNLTSVRRALGLVASWFRDGEAFWLNDGEPAALRNLQLLAALLEAHLATRE